MTTQNLNKSKETISEMFNEISEKYDLLNRSLTLGIDLYWRKKLIKAIQKKPNLKILDIATGTADIPCMLCNSNIDSYIESITGTDISVKMLEKGKEKIHKNKLEKKVTLEEGDACNLKYETESFDLITLAFGIRNMNDTKKALTEMHRVLKKSGQCLILEFSIPKNKIIKGPYLTFFRSILPKIGGLVSGSEDAYSYLNKSVETFPYGSAFCHLLKEVHFKDIKSIPLTSGIATLYIAQK